MATKTRSVAIVAKALAEVVRSCGVEARHSSDAARRSDVFGRITSKRFGRIPGQRMKSRRAAYERRATRRRCELAVVLVDSSIWIEVAARPIRAGRGLPIRRNRDLSSDLLKSSCRACSQPERFAIARERSFRREMLDDPTPLARFEDAAEIYLPLSRDGLRDCFGS